MTCVRYVDRYQVSMVTRWQPMCRMGCVKLPRAGMFEGRGGGGGGVPREPHRGWQDGV